MDGAPIQTLETVRLPRGGSRLRVLPVGQPADPRSPAHPAGPDRKGAVALGHHSTRHEMRTRSPERSRASFAHVGSGARPAITATSTKDAGESDAIAVTVDPLGHLRRTVQFGTTLVDQAVGIATDGRGNVHVVGRTFGDLAGTQGFIDGYVRTYGR